MSDELRRKLWSYEAEPPASAWNDIALLLAEEPEQALPERLYQYQETPPAAIWDGIADRLANEATVVPLFRRLPIWRYAAVAAMLVGIAFGVLYFNHYQSTVPQAAVKNAIPPFHHKKTSIKAPAIINRQDIVAPAPMQAPSLPAVRNSIKKVKKKGSAAISFISTSAPLPKSTTVSSTDMQPVSITGSNQDRYMIYSTADGNAVKISKKLYSWLDCADHTDLVCRQQLSQWQAKLSTCGLAPTSDFTGLIDMVQGLHENQ